MGMRKRIETRIHVLLALLRVFQLLLQILLQTFPLLPSHSQMYPQTYHVCNAPMVLICTPKKDKKKNFNSMIIQSTIWRFKSCPKRDYGFGKFWPSQQPPNIYWSSTNERHAVLHDPQLKCSNCKPISTPTIWLFFHLSKKASQLNFSQFLHCKICDLLVGTRKDVILCTQLISMYLLSTNMDSKYGVHDWNSKPST